MTPTVAVVVCSRDRPEMLRETLRSLASVLRPQDEAVVVDSASRDDGTRRVAEEAGLRVVRCERPGLSRARNAGVGATTAPIVAFTDDDCVVAPAWTERIERAFSDADVGFVGGRVDADVVGRLSVSVSADAEPRRFVAGDDAGALCHGANMAFRRDALERIGGFDECLGAGTRLHAAEDEDAIWRVLRAGWTGRYAPEAAVTHRQWRGTRHAVRLEFGYGIGTGAFAAKVARIDGEAGRALLRRRLLRDGLSLAWTHLRRLHEWPALVALVKAAGVLVGNARGRRLPVRDELFVEPAGGSLSRRTPPAAR